MQPFRARLIAVLTAIALMLPSGAAARGAYFCRMMERVMPACCCAAAKAKAQAAQREAKVSAPDCCQRITAPCRASARAASDSAPQVAAAALAVLLPDFVVAAPSVTVTHAFKPQARAPPNIGPPLFVSHCSFLI